MVKRDLVGKNPSLFRPAAQLSPNSDNEGSHPNAQQAAAVASIEELYGGMSRDEKALFRKRRRRNLRRIRVRRLHKEVDHAPGGREAGGEEISELQHRGVGGGGLPDLQQCSRRPTMKLAGRRGDRRQLKFRTGGDRSGRWIPGGVKRRLRNLRRELATLKTKNHPT